MLPAVQSLAEAGGDVDGLGAGVELGVLGCVELPPDRTVLSLCSGMICLPIFGIT